MQSSTIKKSTLAFLRNLSRNNNRDWFNANKEQYHTAQENVEYFFDGLIARMNTHDQIETPSGKRSLYRIYNDVRFGKGKAPYNPRFAGYLKRTKPLLRGGYYVWIKPGISRIRCGFSYPNPDDLKRIRLDIAANYADWNRLLRSKSLKSDFGNIRGDHVKTAPRGFDKDHPAIDLLRHKQFWFERSFSEQEVLSSDFLNNVSNAFKSIRPFFDYMSEVLTTNLNGERVV
jgi:uncharacterized protein (TIGR02453 family)